MTSDQSSVHSSRFVEVKGSQMHYLEAGRGDPVIFLHGNPTSSFLWRNVLPHMVKTGRCIAPDLIGMGQSDKPDIDYRFFDHRAYLEGFIAALGLNNIILVLHDWGAALGLDFAYRHENRIRAIVLMECLYRPVTWQEQTWINRWMFRRLRDPIKGKKMIVDKNFFVEKVLPMMTLRKLTTEEMDQYRRPFRDPEDRKPVLMWPREIPFDGEPAGVHEMLKQANGWLCQSPIPKLLLWAKPGVLIRKKDLAWFRANVPNLEDRYIGKARHFIQEDVPHAIGEAAADWIAKLGV